MAPISKKASALCESNLLKQADSFRQTATETLAQDSRKKYGQFLTPLPIAALMASIFPSFVPGETVVYIGDTENKFRHYHSDYLADPGV